MSNSFLSLAAWSARVLPMPIKRLFYQVPPLARLLRRALNRAAPEGLTVLEVAGGGLEGCRLELDLQTEKDYWLGTYEPELQTAILDYIKPGEVVYDVGANIGYVSLLLSRRVGAQGQIFAFEALPANLERLRRNLALNDWSENVRIVPAAVVDRSHPVRFLVGPSGGMGKADGSAGRRGFSYLSSLEVPGLALDDFVFGLSNPSPQALKMDIEGGEVLALPGMRRVLAEARPRVLIELHGQESALAAWEAFRQADYRLHKMEKGYPAIHTPEALGWKAYLVAIPDER